VKTMSLKPYYLFFYYQDRKTKLLVGIFDEKAEHWLLQTNGKLNLIIILTVCD